jgi:BirA family biotin operon repressor/biotin-[acetyl-CoA-carboxylase] ligase
MIPLSVTGSCGSTSDECWRRYGSGERGPLAVCSGSQGAGRGTHGRSWFTPPSGNISLSLLLSADRSDAASARFAPLRAAMAVAEVLGRRSGAGIAIKWPNDLMLGGRKIGGILVETRITPGDGPVPMVIGIGVNLNSSGADFPPDLRPLVTTLKDETGITLDEGGVVGEILAAIEGWEDGRE